MIRREDGEGLLILTQTAHSWLSGQLGARWGNEHFRPPEPQREVLLAIEQHDGGWAAWEARPRLLPDGRPMGFLEMDLADHLAIWRQGAAHLATQNLYAALLVSMHGAGLLSIRLERQGDPPAGQAALRAFLAEEQRRQEGLRAALGSVPYYAAGLREPTLTANLRLLQACDALSLMLCVPWPGERRLAVPGAPEAADLASIAAAVADGNALVVDPWPFAVPSFHIGAEGRRLDQHVFADEESFRAALAGAPLVRLEFLVRPKG